MADFLYNSSISRENQVLVVDDIQIPGVQSVSMGYINAAEGLKYLGMGGSRHVPNGQQIGKIDVSTNLFSADYFINYTGTAGCNGGLYRKDSSNSIYFESGYLVSYNSYYSLNSIPEINASFIVFSELGGSEFPRFFNGIDTQHPKLKTIGKGSVNFNNSVLDSNRVIGYSIDITSNRIPTYILGQKTPKEVNINYPIEINCSFDIELNDYEVKNLNKYPLFPHYDNINLQLNDIFTQEQICSYNFGNMLLMSENVASSVDGNVRVKLTYQNFKVS